MRAGERAAAIGGFMARNQRPRPTAEDKKNQKIGCGIMLAALLIVGGCSALIGNDDDKTTSSSSSYEDRPKNQIENDQFVLPDFTGQNLSKAESKANKLDLYAVTSEDLSSLAREQKDPSQWQVCSQDPVSGIPVSTDDTLTLQVVLTVEDCADPDEGLDDPYTDDGGGIAGVGDDCNTSADDPSAANCDESSGGSGGGSDSDSSSSTTRSGGSSSSSTGGSGDSNQAPAGASAVCNDGSLSYSAHRRGTCSHHNGVKTWLKNLPS